MSILLSCLRRPERLRQSVSSEVNKRICLTRLEGGNGALRPQGPAVMLNLPFSQILIPLAAPVCRTRGRVRQREPVRPAGAEGISALAADTRNPFPNFLGEGFHTGPPKEKSRWKDS